MTNQELIDILKKASESQDNIALKMLLIMAAERIQSFVFFQNAAKRIERLHSSLYGDQDE